MSVLPVRVCQCGRCQDGTAHPDHAYHRQMNLLLSRLDEQQRRWYLAVESQRLGHGADRLLFQITGVDAKTIRRGGKNWRRPWPTSRPIGCARREVGACPPKKTPLTLARLQELVAPETAGDPMSAQKWVRSSLRQLSHRLHGLGHPVSPPTVGRLLGQLGYALHLNAKKVEAVLQPGEYKTGTTVSGQAMQALNVAPHAICPTWNYTIRPRPPADPLDAPPNREVIL